MKNPNRIGGRLNASPRPLQTQPKAAAPPDYTGSLIVLSDECRGSRLQRRRKSFGSKKAPESPSHLAVARYGSRNWAVWLGGELLVVAIYKKGADAVAEKLRELSGLSRCAIAISLTQTEAL